MKNVVGLLKREWGLFLSNPVTPSVLIGGPVIFGLLFGFIYQDGKLRKLPAVVIDLDFSPTSAKFIDVLSEMDGIDIKDIRYENVSTRKILMGEYYQAVIIIPFRFEADVLQRRHPEINTYINNANLIPSGYVSRSVQGAVIAFNAGFATQKRVGVPSLQAAQNIEAFKLNTIRQYNPSSNYSFFVWPSFLGIIIQSVFLVVLAISFASEFENRTITALSRSCQGSILAMAFSKLVPYWIFSLGLACVYALYFHVFGHNLPYHIWPALLIFLLFVITVSFQGMIAGLLIKNQLDSLRFLMILSMPAYISSGFSWPFEQDGIVAKFYGGIFPYMPFINGFRILQMQGGSRPDIADYFSYQLVQLSVYASTAFLILAINIRTQARTSVIF